MAVQIGPRIKIDGEREYRAAMQGIVTETKKLASEMKLLESEFSKEGKSIKQNRREKELLKKQIQETEKALKEQQNRLMEVATATDENGNRTQELKNKTTEFQTAVNKTETELNNLRNELKNMPSDLDIVGQKFEDVGNKMKSIGSGLSSTGKTLTRSITAPIVGAGIASVKFGAEFDSQMSAVQAVTQGSAEDLEAMRDAAISWGEKTVYTAKEAGDALYYMGLAGWDSEEAVASLGGVLNLAAAGNLDLGRTSDIVTDAMTAMGYSATEYTNGVRNAEHFSNVLAQAMSNSNTTVDLLGEAFQYVAPVAGSLGYNIEDLAVALGLMANAGIKGSTAGTSLRNILTNMANPSKTMAAAMDELGVQLYDTEGNMLSLGELLVQLRGGFGDMIQGLGDFDSGFNELNESLANGVISEEEYDEALQQIIADTYGAEAAHKAQLASMLAGKRGMAGLLAIVNTSDEEFQSFVDTIYSSDEAFNGLGAGAGIAEQQMDNLQGDITKLTSALGTSQILISDIVKGGLREMVQGFTDLVIKFNELDASQKEQILKWVGIAAAIGPVLVVLGSTLKGIGTMATGVKTLTDVVKNIGPVFGILKGGITGVLGAIGGFITSALPVIGVIAAIGAAAYLLYKNWDDVKVALNTLKETFVKVWDSIAEYFGPVLEAIKGVIEVTFEGIWEIVKTIIGGIAEWISSHWDAIKAVFDIVLPAIARNVQTSFEMIKHIIEGALGVIKGIIEVALKLWQGDFSGAFDGIKTIVNSVLEATKKIIFSLLDNISKQFGIDLSAIKQTVESVFGGIKTFVSGVVDFLKGIFNFEWKLPDIKLPHFSISGGFSLMPPSVPHISIDWYKKAMGGGMILNGATIFGEKNGKLLGGGEAGPEVVVGASSLMGMIQQAVGNGGGGDTDIVINVYGAEGQDVNELAREIEKRLTNMYENRRMVFGQ